MALLWVPVRYCTLKELKVMRLTLGLVAEAANVTGDNKLNILGELRGDSRSPGGQEHKLPVC